MIPMWHLKSVALAGKIVSPKFIKSTSHLLFIFSSKPVATASPSFFIRNYSENRQHRIEESDLRSLEMLANRHTDDPTLQARYLRAAIKHDPEFVIRRFESGNFAHNEDACAVYIDAIHQTSKPHIFNESYSINDNYRSKSSSKTSSGAGYFYKIADIINALSKYAIFALVALLLWKVFDMKVSFLESVKQETDNLSQTSDVTFNDVIGCMEAKKDLCEIVDFLKNPAKYRKIGAKIPSGVLLTGPPGTGKTLLAKAVAGEAGVPFFYASGSEFEDMFVGVGASRVRNLFNTAKKNAPCIIFIDELDALGSSRKASDIHPYSRQTLNQLLVELDGFNKETDVIVLAATNFPESLDKALTRAGRIDSTVHVPRPSFTERQDLFSYYLNKVRHTNGIDISSIAKMTIGLTGADISNVVNQAALRASTSNRKMVSNDDLEWAREKVLHGRERSNLSVTEDDKKMTAVHEAGHAIVAFFTKDARKLHKVSIIPRGSSLGVTQTLPEKDELNTNMDQLIAAIDVCLGGRAAEEIFYGQNQVTTGCSSDLRTASSIARTMVGTYGMGRKSGLLTYDKTKGFALPKEVENEAKTILNSSYQRCIQLLTEKSTEHKRLVEYLLKYETLNQDECEAVITGKNLHMFVD